MSNEPESAEMRAQVRQNAADLTDTLNYIYHKLITMQEHQNEEISVIVSSINGYAEDIKTLNEQISRYEQTGGKPTSLETSEILSWTSCPSLLTYQQPRI